MQARFPISQIGPVLYAVHAFATLWPLSDGPHRTVLLGHCQRFKRIVGGGGEGPPFPARGKQNGGRKTRFAADKQWPPRVIERVSHGINVGFNIRWYEPKYHSGRRIGMVVALPPVG